MANQSITFSLKSTKAGGIWPQSSYLDQTSVLAEIPAGVTTASCSFDVTSSNFGAGTVTGVLVGSVDGVRWAPILDATSGAVAASTAPGVAIFGGGTDSLIDLSPYRFIALAPTEVAGPVDGSVVNVTISADF